jgi:hypothetical protein
VDDQHVVVGVFRFASSSSTLENNHDRPGQPGQRGGGATLLDEVARGLGAVPPTSRQPTTFAGVDEQHVREGLHEAVGIAAQDRRVWIKWSRGDGGYRHHHEECSACDDPAECGRADRRHSQRQHAESGDRQEAKNLDPPVLDDGDGN